MVKRYPITVIGNNAETDEIVLLAHSGHFLTSAESELKVNSFLIIHWKRP